MQRKESFFCVLLKLFMRIAEQRFRPHDMIEDYTIQYCTQIIRDSDSFE